MSGSKTKRKSGGGRTKREAFPALTWLHVSDLHFGHGDSSYRFDQRGVTNAIIENARLMAKRIGPPDLILVTGDIAFSGQPVQYEQAREWLERLRIAVGGAPQLFMVPGNHDVDRSQTTKTSAAAIHAILRSAPTKIDDFIRDPNEMTTVWPKLRAYGDFTKVTSSPQTDASHPFYVKEVPCRLGGKLIVAGLNTALLCLNDQDSPTNLCLGRGQLLQCVEELPHDALLLVLQHHPQEWLLDGDHLVAHLQQRAHIHFSGHVHQQHGVVHLPLLGGAHLRLVAGAGHKDANEEGLHSYSWGQLSQSGLAYYSWVWHPKRQTFFLTPISGTDEFKRDDYAFVKFTRLPNHLRNWLLASKGIRKEVRRDEQRPNELSRNVLERTGVQALCIDGAIEIFRSQPSYSGLEESEVSTILLGDLKIDTRFQSILDGLSPVDPRMADGMRYSLPSVSCMSEPLSDEEPHLNISLRRARWSYLIAQQKALNSQVFTEDGMFVGKVHHATKTGHEIFDRELFKPSSTLCHIVNCQVIIETCDRYLLLMRRSDRLQTHPGCWSLSIEEQMRSHDDEGSEGDESIFSCVYRGLHEEIGIEKDLIEKALFLSCIVESFNYAAGFIFYVHLKVSSDDIGHKWQAARDRSEGSVMALIPSTINNIELHLKNSVFDPKLINDSKVIKSVHSPEQLVGSWHPTSQMRLHVFRKHFDFS